MGSIYLTRAGFQPSPEMTSRVILTEFRIHGSSVPVRPGSVLPKPVWQMNELNLPPEDNGISFEFAALKFSDQARTRYRFILEGLEDKWTEVDSRSRSARYTGLRPAKYRFRVQASTDGKTWSSQEASIGISIATPWWMTPWSLGGVVLAMSGLLFCAYKLRVRSLQESGVRLQRVVDQRTAELLEANRRGRTGENSGGVRQPGQERVPGQYEPRTSYAPQRHPGILRAS